MSKRTSTGAIKNDLPPGIGSPAQRALAAAGITRLDQFTRISEAELLKLHGVGPKAVRIIKEALSARGLKFAADNDSRTISTKANRRIPRRAPKNKG
jgi:predicted flap endonuclease-1-like 5' DNA nuclease